MSVSQCGHHSCTKPALSQLLHCPLVLYIIVKLLSTMPVGTALGPYLGKSVHKEQVEGEVHNEWLWEVSKYSLS